MEIILIQDIDKFGKRGKLMKVKDGFARNYLFPRRLAVPATSANLKRMEQETKRTADLYQQDKEKALSLSKRLSGISITISVSVHDEDKLYGSVSASDILEALKQEGISGLESEAVNLSGPIKSTGVYNVAIKLHPEISTQIKLWVVKR